MGGVDELTDSAALAGDQGALRGRLAEDGYLFFRGLLPAADVRAAAAGVLAGLRRGGWVGDRGIPSADRRALSVLEALGDPAFRAAIASPAFNRIPYLAPLRGLARLILGPEGFSYPAKVLRAVYPERPPGLARGRYIHQDYAVSVLVFHCLTSHAALPNRGTSLRLSGDFRWQRRDQTAPAQLVLGPAGGPHELFSRMFAGQPWWEPVPRGLTLSPRERLAAIPPGPSRYFAVHRGWQRWRPPGGAVH